jgi:hypothetical protein
MLSSSVSLNCGRKGREIDGTRSFPSCGGRWPHEVDSVAVIGGRRLTAFGIRHAAHDTFPRKGEGKEPASRRLAAREQVAADSVQMRAHGARRRLGVAPEQCGGDRAVFLTIGVSAFWTKGAALYRQP